MTNADQVATKLLIELDVCLDTRVLRPCFLEVLYEASRECEVVPICRRESLVAVALRCSRGRICERPRSKARELGHGRLDVVQGVCAERLPRLLAELRQVLGLVVILGFLDGHELSVPQGDAQGLGQLLRGDVEGGQQAGVQQGRLAATVEPGEELVDALHRPDRQAAEGPAQLRVRIRALVAGGLHKLHESWEGHPLRVVHAVQDLELTETPHVPLALEERLHPIAVVEGELRLDDLLREGPGVQGAQLRAVSREARRPPPQPL
mmetsp:Transcript_117286/g.328247  ORF Transcript_117286/g.328247 Transcript_117286/m.328247 type:complete len:265 (-) Transcript_117286:269-1063(-)